MTLTLRRLMPYIYGVPILDVSRSHTTTQHNRQHSSGRVISSSQRPLPDNTRHSQQTNIHAPGGIRTHGLSRRAALPLARYRLCCVVVCDLETSRMGAPYIYDISSLRVNGRPFQRSLRIGYLGEYQDLRKRK